VKILDFGLAKLVEKRDEAATLSMTAEAPSLTLKGEILGTPAYMSPEQVRGEPVDSRSDIFSFGVTLYEMATGKAAFRGPTHQDTLAAILKEEPPPSLELNREVPSELNRIISRCLRKAPEERYNDTRDLVAALKDLQAVTATPTGLQPARSQPSRRLGPVFALVAAIVAIVGLVLVRPWEFENGDVATSQPPRIVVLPFENLGPPEDEYFTDGITEEITSRLSAVRGLRVISRTSAMQYKEHRPALQQIGEELKVEYILEGTVRWDRSPTGHGRVRITPQLIRVADDSHVWSDRYDRVIEDVFQIQSEIGRNVTGSLRVEMLERERIAMQAEPTQNAEAHRLYLKGQYHWERRTPDDIRTSIEYFQQAITIDSTYAMAHAGLGGAYNIAASHGILQPREAFERQKVAVMKALELDSTLARAHEGLAVLHWEYEFNAEDAEKEILRTIELNPNWGRVRKAYSEYLSQWGRHDEAIAEAEQARALEPVSMIVNTTVANAHYYARRYELAIEECSKALELDAGFLPAHSTLGRIYLAQGLHEQAIGSLRTALDLSRHHAINTANLAHALGAANRHSEARDLLDQLRVSADEFIPSFSMALVHLGLGNRDEALSLLEKAPDELFYSALYIGVDPRFDDLRGEPRFKAVLGRMNLPGS
jgi:serine/threonine-protein kinase